jgi:hypothetical protein
MTRADALATAGLLVFMIAAFVAPEMLVALAR